MDSSSFQHQQDGYDPSSQTQTQFPQHPTSLPIVPELPHSSEPSQSHASVQVPPVAGSLNPTAVAVVAGALAQLVGNVDGVPREPTGPSQYRGRGHRGGRSFRGYGRGRFRGRGRGRGRDVREFSSNSSEPTIASVADAPAADGATSVMHASSVSSEQSAFSNPAQVPSAPMQAPPCKFWCGICKAECNTPEMLEQHKNGKRHKKNLLVHEELQRLKARNGQQSGNISTSQSNITVQPEKVSESEKGLPEENMASDATGSNHNDETEFQSNVAGVSEVQTEEPQEEPKHNSAMQGHGFKRKMGGGRGGKYMRTDDGSRKLVAPLKHKQVTSFICELCNVKCDSQIVYNSHLIGKKHLQTFKRVHGHQALNGEAGIQPLHPPVINDLSNANNFPVQQGVTAALGITDPRNLLAQLLMTVLSNVQVPGTAPLSGPVATHIQAPTLMAGSNHEPSSQNLLQTQVSDSLTHFSSENPTGESKDQLSSVKVPLNETSGSSNNDNTETADGRPAKEEMMVTSVKVPLNETSGSSNNDNTETADGRPAKEEMMVKLPQESSVMTPAENPVAANKQVPS